MSFTTAVFNWVQRLYIASSYLSAKYYLNTVQYFI